MSYLDECKPVLVRTQTLGTGIITESRADGFHVVSLPWGIVYLQQQQLGQIISNGLKRGRRNSEDTDEDQEREEEDDERGEQQRINNRRKQLHLEQQKQEEEEQPEEEEESSTSLMEL